MKKDECVSEHVKWVNAPEQKKKLVKIEKKEWNDKWKPIKIDSHSKEYRKAFQDEINKLSKMIDIKFGYDTCIDCGKYLDKEKHQIDACHLISKKKNNTLRYHLDILHSGHNHCNTMNETHESNYKVGLVKRYGQEYVTYVEELPIKYKEIHISNQEIFEKLKLVRSVIRNFETYSLTDSLQARKIFNNLLSIYK